jgi:hypothetical protein
VVYHIERGIGVRVPSIGSNVSYLSSDNADIDIVKPSRSSLAEDEVRGAYDETFGIQLRAIIRVDSILKTVELDAIVALFICLSAHGQCLGSLPASVDKIDVVDFEVCGPGAEGGGQVVLVLEVVLAAGLGDGNGVVGVGGCVFGVAVDA